jgi:hypothetical protein
MFQESPFARAGFSTQCLTLGSSSLLKIHRPRKYRLLFSLLFIILIIPTPYNAGFFRLVRMRLLLIQAYLGRREPPVAPLGLAVLAAHLRDASVAIFDPNVCAEPLKDTLHTLETFQPDLIGLSLRNIDTTKYSDPFYYFEHFQRFAQSIKAAVPDLPLIIGGSGFSLFPEQILQRVPDLDFGFFLDGEESLSHFINNGGFDAAIPGIFYRRNGEVEFTGSATSGDISESPMPAWHLVDLTAYLPFRDRASIGIEAKRGCALSCSYCTYPIIGGTKLRQKEPTRVVDELEWLQREHGVDRVFFCDPVFNYPLEHAEAICRELLRRDLRIRWGAYHQDRFLSRDYVRIARESGCQDFYFSPDAASKQGLETLNKTTTVASLHKSLDLIAADEKARASYNFFASVPGTGWKNFLAALGFLIRAKIRLGRRLTRWKLSYIRLEPGTPLYAEARGHDNSRSHEELLPPDSKALVRLFFRHSRSKLLNALLWLHFHSGRILGRRNVLE